MVFRINWRNFLLHAIDWFDFKEISSMLWVILSYPIGNQARLNTVWKASSGGGGLYPPGGISDYYNETKDYETAKQMYHAYLLNKEDELGISVAQADIYKHIVAPMKHYCNVCIIYTEEESWITDAFSEFLKKYFAIDVVDLDHLFKHGWINGFYLDRELIRERSAEFELTAKLLETKDKLQTPQGRAELLEKMSDKEKVKLLKDLGIKAHKSDNLDRLLQDAWVQSE